MMYIYNTETSSWTSVNNNDFLFETYVLTESEGTVSDPGLLVENTRYVEGDEEVEFFVILTEPVEVDGYQQLPTDQVFTFDPPVEGNPMASIADSSITLIGVRPADHDPNTWDPKNGITGDYTTSGFDSTYPRPFKVTNSDGHKGICIDLFDDSSGSDELFARIWIFTQGKIQWSTNSGYTVISEAEGIITNTPKRNNYVEDAPNFINIGETFDISISQKQLASGSYKGGTATYRIINKLKEKSYRDLFSPSFNPKLRIQIHGDQKEALLSYFDNEKLERI